QAEDGIRDFHVTGVQTCALPIFQLIKHNCGGWMYDLIRGKNFDGAAPFGPVLVTADEVPDPQDLMVRSWVAGELRQEASTRDMRSEERRVGKEGSAGVHWRTVEK